MKVSTGKINGGNDMNTIKFSSESETPTEKFIKDLKLISIIGTIEYKIDTIKNDIIELRKILGVE
jgi:hypothetical protein